MAKTKCPTCGKKAVFAFHKDDTQRWCKGHAKDGMINVNAKQCAADGCEKQPKFAIPGKKAIVCSFHIEKGMINVYAKQCAADGCEKQPNFGMSGKKAIVCKQHIEKGMINVNAKQCAADGCTKQPVYAMAGEKAIVCKQHIEKGMIDVANNRCAYDGCEKHPSYAMAGEKAIVCSIHIEKGMINVVSKQCAADGCEKQPLYAMAGEKAIVCKQHIEKGMINVANKRCELCQMTSMNGKYKPHCAQCHFYLHPDDPRIRNYKTKENAVMAEVQKVYPEIILDSQVAGGCSKRRPDGFIERLEHVIIIEVDENEHRSYDDTCDNKRMMELYKDFGFRKLVFIRLNPDGYTRDGKRIKGAFSVSKTDGKLKSKPKELKKRCADLLEMVDHYILNEPDKAITVEYLYFSD